MNVLRSQRWVIVGLVVLVLSAACSGELQKSDSLDPKATEVWEQHESVLAGAIAGQPWDSDQLLEACIFFEDMTGVEVSVNLSSYAGPIPLAGAAQDLQKIRKWYDENADRMYFDQETQSVQVRPEPASVP